MPNRLQGLIAATCTPLHITEQVNPDMIQRLTDRLIAEGVSGLYVCGSTGEGLSLASTERKTVADQFVTAAKKRVPVIVQVGHNSVVEAANLAAHAAKVGADIISATAPSYFKVASVEVLVDCMAKIAGAAPYLPFYYYHIPALTGVGLDMVEFLEKAAKKIPNLAGIKYTSTSLHEYQACVAFDDGRYDILWGCDEMLLPALSVGCKAAVGSTYNIAAPLYLKLIEFFESGDVAAARECQQRSIEMIRILSGLPFHAALKETLRLLGDECGPCRLPNVPLSSNQAQYLKEELNRIGFFEWSRSGDAAVRLSDTKM